MLDNMDNELTGQQKMARFASPLVGERSPKRSRKSLEPEDEAEMLRSLKIIDVVPGGDALLLVTSQSGATDERFGLRVSSHVMTMASAVFKTKFENATLTREEEPKTVLNMLDEDTHAVLMVSNIIHLQNHKLPARVSVDHLHNISLFAEKCGCKIAVGRSTTQWFDHLYHRDTTNMEELGQLVEAAYLLDEAVWFARFSSRWVLKCSLQAPQTPKMQTAGALKLALILMSRRTEMEQRLRMDLDQLVDVAARCFSRGYKHFIDWAPEMDPEASETPSGQPPVPCPVDGEGGKEFLGALREAHIWPSGSWYLVGKGNFRMNEEEAMQVSIGDIVDRLARFATPEYDDTDACEFCDGINEQFEVMLDHTKRVQKGRLWGLCLDCLNTGVENKGECRFDHAKAVVTWKPETFLKKRDAASKHAKQDGLNVQHEQHTNGGQHKQAKQTHREDHQQVQQREDGRGEEERGGLGIAGL